MNNSSAGGLRPLKKCKYKKFFEKYNSKIKMNECIRCYECENGHEFAEIVKKTEESVVFPCPECGSELESIIMGAPLTVVRDKEPTTLGQCADRNTRKQSKYLRSEEKAKKDAELKEKRTSWFNPEGKDLSFINKMTDKQKKDFILTGDTHGKG